tara:strand:+ start:464 stop:1138 length:675 start_codon:yes stop_codon:yes gene_type:complete
MIRVIDNFYSDPDTIRKFALEQEFPVRGNYPGRRTPSFANDELKHRFENILDLEITEWSIEDKNYNGSFQICSSEDITWIHHDAQSHAAIIYLSPNAPISGGTVMLQDKRYGFSYIPSVETLDEYGIDQQEYRDYIGSIESDYTKWEQIDFIGNVYNRAVLYDGIYYHCSVDYFGRSGEEYKNEQRLFQIFFFDSKEAPSCYCNDTEVYWSRDDFPNYKEDYYA